MDKAKYLANSYAQWKLDKQDRQMRGAPSPREYLMAIQEAFLMGMAAQRGEATPIWEGGHNGPCGSRCECPIAVATMEKAGKDE